MRWVLLLCALLVLSGHHRPRHAREAIWIAVPATGETALRVRYNLLNIKDDEKMGACKKNQAQTWCIVGSSRITPGQAIFLANAVTGGIAIFNWPPLWWND